MGWTMTRQVDQFLAEAGDFLHAEAARNTVILSVTENLRRREKPGGGGTLFGWWREGTVTGAFMHTEGLPLFLTSMSGAAAAGLAEDLAAAGRAVPGVNGAGEAAAAFAAAWRQHTGDDAAVHVRMRLYKLGRLVPPEPAPAGAPRVAAERDRDLLVEWYRAFGLVAGDPPGRDYSAEVSERLGYGGLTLWEAGGVPVSMAGLTRVVRRTARVAPVYTPPALRGRGYAAAVTAAVSQAALDAGAAEVVLYTDLANPTPNSVYQRLGYAPVEDRLVLEFRRPGVTLQP